MKEPRIEVSEWTGKHDELRARYLPLSLIQTKGKVARETGEAGAHEGRVS